MQSFFRETDLIKQECAHTHLRSDHYSCFVEKGGVPDLQFLLTATLYKELYYCNLWKCTVVPAGEHRVNPVWCCTSARIIEQGTNHCCGKAVSKVRAVEKAYFMKCPDINGTKKGL